MSNKLVQSTRDYEEHLKNILQLQEMKSKGMSDKLVCQELGIGFSTLKKYKETLCGLQMEHLSEDYLKEKKGELDEQVQSIIAKLYMIISKLEDHHDSLKQELEKVIVHLNSDDQKDQEKIYKLKRYTNYPVKDVAELIKLVLEAAKLRSTIWGNEGIPEQGGLKPKRVVLSIDASPQIRKEMGRLDEIADSIVRSKTDGLP